MDISTVPIIRLEVERMKHTIVHALSQHVTQMDASVIAAVEAYCTPENIDYVVRKAATEAIDDAVKEEVRNFFRLSRPGRIAVREAVIEHLDKWDKLYE